MAIKAPTYDGLNVAPAAAPGPPSQGGVSPAAFGAGLGEGVSDFGAVLGSVAVRAKERADDLAVLSASEQLDRAYIETRTNLLSLENDALLKGYDPTMASFGTRAAEIDATLTPAQRRLFASRLAARRADLEATGQSHLAGGIERYDDATTQRKLDTLREVALSDGSLERGLNDIHDVLSGKYARNSYRLDPAAMAADEQVEATKLIGAAVDGALARGDWQQAQAIAAEFGERMPAEARTRMDSDLQRAVTAGSAQLAADALWGKWYDEDAVDQVGAGGDVRTAEDMEADAKAEARQIEDPETRDKALDEITAIATEAARGRADKSRARFTVLDRKAEAGAAWALIEGDPLYSFMDADQRAALKARVRDDEPAETNETIRDMLWQEAANDPARFVERDPRTFRRHFTQPDYAALESLHGNVLKALRDGDEAAAKLYQGFLNEDQSVETYVQDVTAGIDQTEAEGKKAASDAAVRFRSEVNRQGVAKQGELERPLSPPEWEELAGGVAAKMVLDAEQTDTGALAYVSGGVPLADVLAIRAAMIEQGLPADNPAAVAVYYRKAQLPPPVVAEEASRLDVSNVLDEYHLWGLTDDEMQQAIGAMSAERRAALRRDLHYIGAELP